MTGPAPTAAGVTASSAELAAELKDRYGHEALGISLLLLGNAHKTRSYDELPRLNQVAILLSESRHHR